MPQRPTRRTLFALFAISAVFAAVVDQFTKWWALTTLTPGQSRPLVGSLIELNLIRNPGAAFSIGDGVTWLLTLIAVAVLVWVGVVARTLGHVGWALALGLLLGGSVGNLIDRIVREPAPGRGHVVDFIDYSGVFIGNVADIAIVGSAIGISVLALRGIPVSGHPVQAPPSADEPMAHEDLP
jgi:signal peptidase II